MRKPDWLEFRDTNAMFPVWMAVVFVPAFLALAIFDK